MRKILTFHFLPKKIPAFKYNLGKLHVSNRNIIIRIQLQKYRKCKLAKMNLVHSSNTTMNR